MNIYIDESGDLGWIFDKPFQYGGSSRYLTITAVIVPKSLSNYPKRIVKKIYSKRKQSTAIEIKGKDLSKDERVKFAQRVVRLLRRQPSIKINSITVKKENVQQHIKADPNKLYNYMVNLALLDKIRKCSVVDFIPDPRSIKVKSQNSLVDYLQTKLWFEYNSATVIRYKPMESHLNINLQFADFVSYIIWSRFEYNKSDAFNIFKPFILIKHLFF
jgi:hypothetical protein